MSLRDLVRAELVLGNSGRRRMRRGFSGLLGFAALFGLWPASAASALSYRQELLPEISSLDVGFHGSAELADVDGDGDLDLVSGETSGRLAIFANTGGPDAPSFVQATGSANPFRAIVAGGRVDLSDLDGDGDLDLTAGAGSGQLLYFANTGSSEAPFYVERSGSSNPFAGIDVGSFASPDLVDLDSDGDLDAVIGENNSRLYYFANTGNSSSPAFVAVSGSSSPFWLVQPTYLYNLDPVLADLDGDGDLDLIFGDNYGRLRFSRNTGSSTAPRFTPYQDGPLAMVDLDQNTSAAFGDLDGDADLDVVVTDYRGAFYLLENTAGTAAPSFVERTGSDSPFGSFLLGGLASPEVADLDGDGDLDAIFGLANGSVPFAENTGSAAAPSFASISFPFLVQVAQQASPALADLDGDGDQDLLVGSQDGTLRLFENTGDVSAAAFLEVAESANPFRGIDVGTISSPELKDLDGDGDFDAITGRGGTGGLRYLENTGSSSAPDFILRTGTASPFAGIAAGGDPSLADLDGDGDLDLMQGTAFYENTGTASAPIFVARTGAGNPLLAVIGEIYSVEPADLDGDGDFDLLCGDFFGRVVFQRANSVELFTDGFEDGGTAGWSATFGGS